MEELSERRRLIEELRIWEKDVFAVTQKIVDQQAFCEGKAHFTAMLQDLPVRDFDRVLDLHISDDLGYVPKEIDAVIGQYQFNGGAVDALGALAICMSAHGDITDADGRRFQNVELSLFTHDYFDFLGAPDADLASFVRQGDWLGEFVEEGEISVDGMHDMLILASELYTVNREYRAFLVEDAGAEEVVARNEFAFARVVSNALVAVEFHRFAHALLPQLSLPREMIVVIGQHDLLHVPYTHYRLAANQKWSSNPRPDPHMAQVQQEALRSIANIAETTRQLETLNGHGGASRKVFGRRVSNS